MLWMVLCLLFAARASCQAPPAQLEFDAASIRPTDPSSTGWKLEFTLNGLTGRGVTLRMLVEEAYGVYEDDRILGLPAWAKSQRFDVEAKQASVDDANLRDLTLDERRAMLKELLDQRFALKSHKETRDADVFVLEVAKHGAKLDRAKSVDAVGSQLKGFHCLISSSGKDFVVGQSCTTADLADVLRGHLDRTIKDETGLLGRYDFSLRWAIEDDGDTAGPSIFTALQEQLGLKLVPSKRTVDFVLVDRVEEPSAN
jgi:uncharacterized protein (TIGR03435 family)